MATDKKQLTPKERAKKKRRNIILFIVEIFILLTLVVVLWAVLKVEKVQQIDINPDKLDVSEEVKEMYEDPETEFSGYRNIALFGIDSLNNNLGKGDRTDTMIIASINEETKEVKLVSVYRDTFLNVGKDKNDNSVYGKCNAAYFSGGPEQAINMLNMNLDLYITDFVTVGFKGLIEAIDAIGGIMIDVDSAELSHLNNYQISMSEGFKGTYTPVENTGYQLLNGMQATAYCRIRYTKGDDYKRAERQREVILAITEKAMKSSPATLNKIADRVFPHIATSIKLDEILAILAELTEYKIIDNTGFPKMDMLVSDTIGGKGSCVVPISLQSNVVWLHEFLFGKENYEPTDAVKEYSKEIFNQTDKYLGKKTNTKKESEKEPVQEPETQPETQPEAQPEAQTIIQ